MILKRIKKFKLDVKSKVWIICDRKRKLHECTKQNRRHDDNIHIECFFLIIVKLVDENSDSWIFEIKNSKHNHAFIIIDAHLVLKRMIMTREIKIEIFKQMIVQITFRKILSSLCLFHDEKTNSNFDLINSDINLMIRSRDIYNIKAQLRKDDLDFMTSIQVFMHQLFDKNWFFVF
jgi:adenosyl cobinamide kinase/adenosyl cobinamide phosphate guanylyltransferase